jgi:hypothetical protein
MQRQAATRFEKSLEEFLPCPGYIVHFLTSLPDATDVLLPPYIMNRFNALRRAPYQSTALEAKYEIDLGGQYHSSAVIPIWSDPIEGDPTTHAVIIKLQRIAAATT